MRSSEPLLRWIWCAALVLAYANSALAQVPAGSTRVPATTQPRVSLPVQLEPRVTSAAPAAPKVLIGGQTVSVRLNGSQLGQVVGVQVADSTGNQQFNVEASIVEGSRSDNALPLMLFAKRNARPGRYRLRLMLAPDPNERQIRPPGSGPLGTVLRSLELPESAVAITVEAMDTRIVSITPSHLPYSIKVQPHLAVVDVPGTELVSVTNAMGTDADYCRFKPDPSVPPLNPSFRGGVWNATWTGPHKLEVVMQPGEFERDGQCRMQLTIRTKNNLGEEFYSLTQKFVVTLAQPPAPTPLPVTSTWELRNYLHLPSDFTIGVCSGNSVGFHGSVPVGIVNVNGKLGFRARSGPIGTECHWRIATYRLRPGWTLHMDFRVRRLGDKCRTTDGSTPQFDFSALRSATILNDGEYVLRKNLNEDGDALKLVGLRCDATASNDHEILVEMVSARVISGTPPPSNCTWRCAFQ